MNNFISCNTWIWSAKPNSTRIKVLNLATSYYIKMEIGHSSIDLAISRTGLQELRDKINELLIAEEKTNE